VPIPLEISTPNLQGTLYVSKSRKHPLLLSDKEMEVLLNYLDPIWMFDVSRPLKLELAEISRSRFLGAYRDYIRGIQSGELVEEGPLHPYFSAVMTCDPKCVYAQMVSGGKYLIKTKKPCIQLKRHHFIYSEGFHLCAMGRESVTWGIQFSYPHLYMNSKTKVIGKVEKNPLFSNTDCFHRLSKWVRLNTRPTPFVVDQRRINQPMRLGVSCFPWINRHPGLIERGLYVHTPYSSQSSD
jgi:hypothetical protein